MIKFHCKNCKQRLEIDDVYLGEIVVCSNCEQETIVAPAPIAASVQTVAPPSTVSVSPITYPTINPQKYVRKTLHTHPVKIVGFILSFVILVISLMCLWEFGFFVAMVPFVVAFLYSPIVRCGHCQQTVDALERGCVHCNSNFSN